MKTSSVHVGLFYSMVLMNLISECATTKASIPLYSHFSTALISLSVVFPHLTHWLVWPDSFPVLLLWLKHKIQKSVLHYNRAFDNETSTWKAIKYMKRQLRRRSACSPMRKLFQENNYGRERNMAGKLLINCMMCKLIIKRNTVH